MQREGQVAVVTKNKYGYGMKIEGCDDWFNSKYDPKCAKGDIVTFDCKGKQYIDGLSIVGVGSTASSGGGDSSGGGKGGHDQRQTSIVRQNAVTNANSFVAGTGTKIKTIGELLDLAREIEVYTIGKPEGVEEEVPTADVPVLTPAQQEQLDQLEALKALAGKAS